MPIKLVHASNGTNPMEVSLDDYEEAVREFEDHYYVSAEGSTEFGGKDFSIPYSTLETCVQDFATAYQVSPEDVAVRFIHCYNIEDQSLYMRMQLCTMHVTDEVEDGHRIYDLNLTYEDNAWYTVTQDNLTATEDHDQSDANYTGTFYYMNEEDILEPLTDGDTFVNSLTYPWFYELLPLYTQNGSPEGASIHFASCSYLVDNEGEIPWPHGLIMYLADAQGMPLLDDQDYISMFTYKGADYGTACPPYCNVYIAPTDEPF